jgi:uncharacterized protein YlxW (UPF0749 family)
MTDDTDDERETSAEETQPEETQPEETQPPRDERSREEPPAATRRDEVAIESEIAPEPASGARSDSNPASRSVQDRSRIRRIGQLRRINVRAGALIGVLTALLGFAIAVQVRSNSSSDSLSNAREDDLIRILDDQNARADRLNRQIADLQNTLDELQRSGNSDAVAQQQAQRELESLQVLLGTVAASGPGVTVEISDPQRKLKAEDLLDVVEELRGAGAESIQFGPVRVTTASSFVDAGDGVHVDGQALNAPYRVLAIGDPKTLDTALNIPGGVAATARNAGGDAQVVEQQQVDVTARSTVPSPKYAAPAGR